jgi:hypothetical protein
MPKLPIDIFYIDGNRRVQDRGLGMHHGHVYMYLLCN